ncbi:MAG: hypothetical protein COY38_02385 [Candidatus Aenigmarchaeota archaeon CG_4_10_14_0_8_um_filter_37_24]|nr:hypothetical protein [Candidatus Aenigmarchaeota archaeon]OIN88636.1 MAG: hypothetical protein AUJ50_00375 [Candidatus Aenigmarchaeota archaeon CG1_02_38_14]PIW40940.1 MAG: hypothetical protein COW21_04535 [Candidatus Aenigmarchaeota archaeon CG15_BIG_FIL_POST_REV_8_21_14_020_37_27]PIX50365.1 MAG: hypothetical protein COZ52_04495 [Candidatus Aenigmarchaeota archaeon CG_4_8_14_3_um_filter_37_24]PIY36127.1 MAG: hypothetical protein COZ04_01220 [Candidatus Aenigmarchaeota archaeon CG_4_10_14_3_
MKKGVSFSVIPIIALLGVLALSIWAGYQLSIGSSYNKRYGDVFSEDPSVFKMETVKKILEDGLKFSAQDASLEIAANGGTGSTTFWYCAYEDKIPTPEEVKYHFSNLIKTSLNAYAKNSNAGDLFEINVDIPEYTCTGVYDNGESKCSSRDSSECEDFWVTATGNSQIILKEPNVLKEDDSISAIIPQNRFWWIYYRLYDDYNGNSVHEQIQNSVCVPGESINRGEVRGRIESALNEVCRRYENSVLDGYVDCSYEIDCFFEMDGSRNCLNTLCSREPFNEELCDSPEVVRVAGKTNDNDVEKVFFQDCTPYREDHSYSDTDWLRFRIVLKDSKYNIPSMSKDLKNLVWKIQGAIIIDYNQCPIEWTVNIDPCSGGSNELPGGVTPEPPPY